MKFKFIAKNNISTLPKTPGVYAFLARRLRRPKATSSAEGRSLGEGGKKGKGFLYIGKAANIKERVKNHCQQPGFRGNLFINQADKLGFIKADSEIEALILEAKLIKKYQPKYNVMWKDDKNYFYVGITKENYPRVLITHQPQYVSRILYPVSGIKSKKIRNQSTKIHKVFGARPSPKLILGSSTKYKIQNTKFVGPFVDGRALKQALNTLRRIFPYRTCKPYSGKPCLWYQLDRCPGPCLLGSKLAMEIPGHGETIKKESQRNARSLKKILEGGKNQVLKDLKKEMKNASRIKDFEKAAKIRDQIESLEKIIKHAKIFDWIEPENLRKRRSPDSYGWKETEKNLRKILKIKRRVKRIEAYDISNIQGQNATGSMVTFINGRPDKNFYRRFKIKNRASKGSESKNIRSSLPFAATRVGEEEGEALFAFTGKPNDVAMLKEILSRRFKHPEWGWPDLILIDGGKAQLNIALQCLNLKFKHIKAMALAKKENKLFIEGKKQPVLLKTLPREIFNLILQLRDEAHRFAVAYHRKLRERF